ncbi:hypothetical protein BKA64DRAFT_704678 [Cadophora sp. MPI-SDFR-AT-0126]|nr:hypothetical protein BKA64DRAFT_704678 [Leotiomycetes sp. MPI-SDFR-AT-0126]
MTTLRPIERDEPKALAGKTVIVTGGASGIGRATVLLTHEQVLGANVVVADLNTSVNKELETQLQE